MGGESRFIATPSYTPHRIAFGLTPSALRLPLKGGVNLKPDRGEREHSPHLKDFFNNPEKRAFVSKGEVRASWGIAPPILRYGACAPTQDEAVRFFIRHFGGGQFCKRRGFSTAPFLTPSGAYDKRKTLGR